MTSRETDARPSVAASDQKDHVEPESRSVTGARGIAVLLSITAMCSVAGSVQPAAPPPVVRADLPSPLAGPGVGVLKKSHERKIERGWRDLRDGDLEAARKRAAKVGAIAPSQLLVYQVMLVEGAVDVSPELEAFCNENPEYAAAWLTLSVAAERSGAEVLAIQAARRSAELWGNERWISRADALYRLWVTDRINMGRLLLDQGDTGEAMAEVERALNIEPSSFEGALVKAEILLAEDHIESAESLLVGLGDVPEVLLLLGRIAEGRNDWETAMDCYSRLPEDHAERSPLLNRAQTQWRISVLPTYARNAMATQLLTRGDLAVILVSMEPRLETLPGGSVPVMSDIVDHPGQREIITVSRLGIMETDRRGRLFHPDAQADADTVRETVNRAARLLGLAQPMWCPDEDVVGSDCTPMPSPPDGGTVVKVVLDIASGVIDE